MSQLFSPWSIGSLTLENRIVIAPMCQYSAVEGVVGAWHSQHIGSLACSGAGLLIMEATGVTANGRITPQCVGLWNDQQASALARLIDDVRQYSAMPLGIQLAHAGRKGSHAAPWKGGALLSERDGGWVNEAPSALAFTDSESAPKALTTAEIQGLVEAFVKAARRAQASGFDVIELHGAHGYLLHQFLSPLSNTRTDEYGGSFENRARFVYEVLTAVKAAVSIPVGIRLSATDWVDGGWDLAETELLSVGCEQRGAAFIHVSSGGLSPQQAIKAGPGFQVPFAQAVKRRVTIPVIAVGLITQAQQAEDIVLAGQADAIGLARAMLYNPRWPYAAAKALGAQVTAPAQYWRSAPADYPSLYKGA